MRASTQEQPAAAKSPFAHRAGRAETLITPGNATPPPKKSKGPVIIIAAVLLLIAGAAVFFLNGNKADSEPVHATPKAAPATPDKPLAKKPPVAEPPAAKVSENKIQTPAPAPTPPPTPKAPEAGEIFISAKLGLAFAFVPPGSFLEGSPSGETGRNPDEVRRKVTLTRGFRLGVTCVTQAQWDAVTGPGSAAAKLSNEKRAFIGADLPMVNVTWAEAETFCRRLSETEGAKYRLPTEAEWEYACRAGSDAPYGGDKAFLAPGDAVFDDGGAHPPESPRTVSAPKAPVNAWGLRDMHGNVWQWCADRYASRTEAPATDPLETSGTDESTGRVVRGGSWNDPARSARSAKRWQYPPAVAVNYIGFRVLLECDATGRPR